MAHGIHLFVMLVYPFSQKQSVACEALVNSPVVEGAFRSTIECEQKTSRFTCLAGQVRMNWYVHQEKLHYDNTEHHAFCRINYHGEITVLY
jgi:hypothetical protein